MSRQLRPRLADVHLPDGTVTWCFGFRGGLPVWRYGWAPAGLVTTSQLAEQRLRRARGQSAVGLLVFHRRGCGEQEAPLYRIDQAVLARTQTPALRASVEAMRRAHRTCRRCHIEQDCYLPTSTWLCWPCMTATGNYGDPHASHGIT